MKLFKFNAQLVEKVLNYLQTKPFVEVSGLIGGIMAEVNAQNNRLLEQESKEITNRLLKEESGEEVNNTTEDKKTGKDKR
jgi:hypothetical protein